MPEHPPVQRLVWLIHQHLKEDITEEEKEELSRWIEGPGNRSLFDCVTSEDWLEKELPAYNGYEKQSGEDWKKIEESVFGKSVFARVREAPKWMRYTAMAFILVGLIIAALRIFVTHPSKVTSPILAVNNQVEPSRRSVILFLDDGRVIQMENERSGIVTKQGLVKVVKKKGQLFYLMKTSVADSSLTDYIPDQEFISGPLLDSPGTTKKTEKLVTQFEENFAFGAWNTLKVPIGGQFTITLADGSRIWLNSQSILRYPVQFNGLERKVYLSGEAYFEVRSNPSHPFVVSVHRDNDSTAMEFQAVGTKFNIRAYNDEPGIIATVVEGEVKALSEGQTYLVPLHGQLQLKDGNYTVVRGEGDQGVTAWKDGYLVLDGTIEELMNVIKRWYGIEVVLKTVHKRLFTGRLPMSTPFSEVVKVLNKNGFRVDITGNVVTVSDD